MTGFCEVKIDQIGGCSALDTGDFEGLSDKAGEPETRVAWDIFLVISALVGFVDDD